MAASIVGCAPGPTVCVTWAMAAQGAATNANARRVRITATPSAPRPDDAVCRPCTTCRRCRRPMADAAHTASPEDEEITALVDAAMRAHLEGGETELEAFCSRLGRHRDVVLRRLAALRRVGLLGDAAAGSPT